MSELQPSQQQPSAPPPSAVTAIGDDSGSQAPITETPKPSTEPPADPPPKAADEAPNDAAVDFDTDWRRHIAGDDEAALNELARVKTPQDLAKLVVNQKKELSKRAVSGAFPADADEATQQAWREHHGVPDEGTMQAYGVKPPENYEMPEVESSMVNDFIKDMHAANAPKDYVQKSVDKWFQLNEATRQQMNVIDQEREGEWSSAVKSELGKDYEPIVAASNAFIEQRIEDPEVRGELLNARLPNGGILARHPEFIKLVGDLALQNGYGDRIEANSMEASGKSLGEQQREIEAFQQTDKARYNAPEVQERLDKIIGLRLSRGEIDEMGNEIKKR